MREEKNSHTIGKKDQFLRMEEEKQKRQLKKEGFTQKKKVWQTNQCWIYFCVYALGEKENLSMFNRQIFS